MNLLNMIFPRSRSSFLSVGGVRTLDLTVMTLLNVEICLFPVVLVLVLVSSKDTRILSSVSEPVPLTSSLLLLLPSAKLNLTLILFRSFLSFFFTFKENIF